MPAMTIIGWFMAGAATAFAWLVVCLVIASGPSDNQTRLLRKILAHLDPEDPDGKQ